VAVGVQVSKRLTEEVVAAIGGNEWPPLKKALNTQTRCDIQPTSTYEKMRSTVFADDREN
jgi:hypothetical protein